MVHGESMENLWKIYGNLGLMENLWKSMANGYHSLNGKCLMESLW